MKKIVWIALGGVFLLGVSPAHAWRCGNLLVREGVHLEAVLHRCGEPVSREDLGTTSRKGGTRVEKLVYGPDGGMYYVLRFEGGSLKKIESQRAQ